VPKTAVATLALEAEEENACPQVAALVRVRVRFRVKVSEPGPMRTRARRRPPAAEAGLRRAALLLLRPKAETVLLRSDEAGGGWAGVDMVAGSAKG